MSLNIHVEAEPRSMHSFVEWLTGLANRVKRASDASLTARSRSFAGWDGEAGEGFRAVAYRMHFDGDQLEVVCRQAARSLNEHAHDITVVREKMAQARDIATRAGLFCTDREIHEPGAAPPNPQAIIDNGKLTSSQDGEWLRRAWDVWNTWVDKAKAYARCITLVTEARTLEHDSQNKAVNATKDITPGSGSIITSTNFLNSLVGGYLARQASWRATTTALAENATEHMREAKLLERVPGKAGLTIAHWRAAAINEARSARASLKVNTNKIGGWLERMPPRVQSVITADLERFIPENSRYLAKAPAIVKKIPVIGTALTAESVRQDLAAGKDPEGVIFKHGSGLGAAVGTSMIIGGPGGAVVSFVVGTGVTELIESGQTYNPPPGDSTTLAPGSGFPR